MERKTYPKTPDGRYFVVAGRLWRLSNPNLEADEREELVRRLMAARRAVYSSKDDAAAVRLARRQVNAAKVALGERGPVWWEDAAPDFNRHMAKNTPYADWFLACPRPADRLAKPAHPNRSMRHRRVSFTFTLRRC